MTQELKYYTPEKEDIRIGYEYEEYTMYLLGTTKETSEFWKKQILTEGNCVYEGGYDFETIISNINEGIIRVPYLNKEQIEKEGWYCVNNIELSFQKILEDDTWWEVHYDVESHNLIIEYWKDNPVTEKSDGFTKFNGCINSINEFRTICKLLRI